MKKAAHSAGVLKAIVRRNKRERGLVPAPEIWLLPEQRPRLDALLEELKREQAAHELLT